MKKYLFIAVALLFSGCAAFDEQAYWPDSAYGGPLKKVSYEGWLEHHERFRSAPTTTASKNTVKVYHYHPNPTASCVDHSIWTIAELEERGMQYELVVLTGKFATPHSVVKVGDQYLDINFQEPRPASEYSRTYDNARSLGKVKSKNVHDVLTALGYKYK